MIRILLFQIVFFLLPFVLWRLYTLLAARNNEEAAEKKAPVFTLFMTGLVLAVVGLFVFVDFGNGSPEGTYVPPQYKDGKIIPGHVE